MRETASVVAERHKRMQKMRTIDPLLQLLGISTSSGAVVVVCAIIGLLSLL